MKKLFALIIFILVCNACHKDVNELTVHELPAGKVIRYLNLKIVDLSGRDFLVNTQSLNSNRDSTFTDIFKFSIMCGNDNSCFSGTPPSPMLLAGDENKRCYATNDFSASFNPNNANSSNQVPMLTEDDGTVKMFCRIGLTGFIYTDSGENYAPQSQNNLITMDMDFRRSPPNTQTTYGIPGSGTQYNSTSGVQVGKNLYAFFKYTSDVQNTDDNQNNSMGTVRLLFSTTNSAEQTPTDNGNDITNQSLPVILQSTTLLAPQISGLIYQAIPGINAFPKQYTVFFNAKDDETAANAITSADRCRIFTLDNAMTQVLINNTFVSIPTDLTSAQNLFLTVGGNMLPFSQNSDEYVDCAANSFTTQHSGSFFGVLNQWNTPIATPIAGASAPVTLGNSAAAPINPSVTLSNPPKPRLVVFASDATNTTSGTARKNSRAFVLFKIPATTSSNTAW